MIAKAPFPSLRQPRATGLLTRFSRFARMGLSASVVFALPVALALPFALPFALSFALSFALLPPNQAHATEVCSQAPSAFERVDPGGDESGVGGTGVAPSPHVPVVTRGDDESGIGGTGRAPRSGSSDESGIGGTGILGTVLRVDRLCVNGFEIQVPDTLQIESAMGSEGPQGLTVGQIVFIRALRTDSNLIAQRIQIQRDFEGAPWENGPRLELLSIEGFVSDGPGGPRIGRFQLDFGSSEIRPDARDLRPGTRVRATGQPGSGGILRIAPPLRPDRLEEIERAPAPPSEPAGPEAGPTSRPPTTSLAPSRALTRPDAGGARDTTLERPKPKSERSNKARPERLERTERAEPPSPPERPERPPTFERPERPALDERPLPRVIERPDVIDRSNRR